MPEGKEISFNEGEYPQLEGLPEGSEVKFSGVGTVTEADGMTTLTFDKIEFETENVADRELRQMSKSDTPQESKRDYSDDF